MDAALERAMVGAAGELQVLVFESGVDNLKEADLRAAVRRSLRIELGRNVLAEAPLRVTTWRGAGAVDVAVSGSNGGSYDAVVELKLWKEIGKIDEALWDVWKLGSAYKEGLASSAYLIAVGPERHWSSDRPARRFFDSGIWKAASCWSDFARTWKYWVTPTSGPIELPAGLRTKHVASVPIHIARSEPWQLEAVRVTTTPGRAFVVPEGNAPHAGRRSSAPS